MGKNAYFLKKYQIIMSILYCYYLYCCWTQVVLYTVKIPPQKSIENVIKQMEGKNRCTSPVLKIVQSRASTFNGMHGPFPSTMVVKVIYVWQIVTVCILDTLEGLIWGLEELICVLTYVFDDYLQFPEELISDRPWSGARKINIRHWRIMAES